MPAGAVCGVHVVPSREVRTVRFEPTATKTPSHATPNSCSEVPEVLAVQLIPFSEVMT
jgi:hypothetical protein